MPPEPHSASRAKHESDEGEKGRRISKSGRRWNPDTNYKGLFMEKAKALATAALTAIALGALVGTGIRAAEWVIPAPEMRVIVCTIDDFDHVETCTSAAKLLNKHAD